MFADKRKTLAHPFRSERKAIGSLKRNSEINLKKADKGKLQSLLTKSTSPHSSYVRRS